MDRLWRCNNYQLCTVKDCPHRERHKLSLYCRGKCEDGELGAKVGSLCEIVEDVENG